MMIIRFPTGLYRDVVPQAPGVSGNTTYTISTTNPPRTNLIFPKIPTGVVLRQRTVSEISLDNRRSQVGELIFSISSAKRLELGNNSRQYQIGDVLEFDTGDTPNVEPMLVNQTTEIRHDTNILNISSMGLSEADAEVIASASLKAQETLTVQLNLLKQQRVDAETTVTTQQKIINEANKTIEALTTINISSPSDSISALILKLTTNRDAAIVNRDVAIANANSYASAADEVLLKLRSVAVVVK